MRNHQIEGSAAHWRPFGRHWIELFYTVTLPCTLWFLDKGKSGTDHKDKVLFIDARHTFEQVDRASEAFRLRLQASG